MDGLSRREHGVEKNAQTSSLRETAFEGSDRRITIRRFLLSHEERCRTAFLAVPFPDRLLCVNAYFSRIWNLCASERVSEKPRAAGEGSATSFEVPWPYVPLDAQELIHDRLDMLAHEVGHLVVESCELS